jgi:hypothetical protein
VCPACETPNVCEIHGDLPVMEHSDRGEALIPTETHVRGPSEPVIRPTLSQLIKDVGPGLHFTHNGVTTSESAPIAC